MHGEIGALTGHVSCYASPAGDWQRWARSQPLRSSLRVGEAHAGEFLEPRRGAPHSLCEWEAADRPEIQALGDSAICWWWPHESQKEVRDPATCCACAPGEEGRASGEVSSAPLGEFSRPQAGPHSLADLRALVQSLRFPMGEAGAGTGRPLLREACWDTWGTQHPPLHRVLLPRAGLLGTPALSLPSLAEGDG